MLRNRHCRHAATLTPGYYRLSVKPSQGESAGSLFFESEGGALQETEVQFKDPGSMLLCLRASTKIGVGKDNHPGLDYARLGPARTAYTKIVNRARLKQQNPDAR